MSGQRATQDDDRFRCSYDDVKDVLITIAENNLSHDQILITAGEIQGQLKLDKNIDVRKKTIRNKGVSHRGYFYKKYKSIKFNNANNSNERGLLVKPEQFLDEVDE